MQEVFAAIAKYNILAQIAKQEVAILAAMQLVTNFCLGLPGGRKGKQKVDAIAAPEPLA